MRATSAEESLNGPRSLRGRAAARREAVLAQIRRAWARFRQYGLFTAVGAYYTIVLGALNLQVGSTLMLGSFVVIVTLFLAGVLARLMNGWKLIAIVVVHGLLVLLLVRGLNEAGVPVLSELALLQITMPLGLGCAWILDENQRERVATEAIA